MFLDGLRMQFDALNTQKIVKKFPQTPLTLKISILRSNFISRISRVLRRFSYVIWCAEYAKNSKKFPQTPLSFKISILRSNFISRIRRVLRRFWYVIWCAEYAKNTFSASMTLESHIQLSLMQKMKCGLDCRFARSRRPQWFFSYSIHQIT